MSSKEWGKGLTNDILKFKGFFISYNPNSGSGHMGGILTDVGNLFAETPLADGEETALVKGDKYYILTGDWRKEYEELGPKGFDACLDFFMSEPSFWNSWTTDYEALRGDSQ